MPKLFPCPWKLEDHFPLLALQHYLPTLSDHSFVPLVSVLLCCRAFSSLQLVLLSMFNTEAVPSPPQPQLMPYPSSYSLKALGEGRSPPLPSARHLRFRGVFQTAKRTSSFFFRTMQVVLAALPPLLLCGDLFPKAPLHYPQDRSPFFSIFACSLARQFPFC